MLGWVVWELVPLGRVRGVAGVLEVEAIVGVGSELPVLVEAERGAVVSVPLQQEASDALVEGVPVVRGWPWLWRLLSGVVSVTVSVAVSVAVIVAAIIVAISELVC